MRDRDLAWFSDYVLTVGAVTPEAAAAGFGINGPWVSVAAPGWRIMGLSNTNGAAVNARPDEPRLGCWFLGTSFGRLRRRGGRAGASQIPRSPRAQVIRRITETAQSGPRVVTTRWLRRGRSVRGAATFDVPLGDPKPVGGSAPTCMYLRPAGPDHRPRNSALLASCRGPARRRGRRGGRRHATGLR